MENEIVLKVEGDYDDSILASTSQEVLVEVRGTPPPSHEGHVVIASAPHSSQDCTVNEFKLVDEGEPQIKKISQVSWLGLSILLHECRPNFKDLLGRIMLL